MWEVEWHHWSRDTGMEVRRKKRGLKPPELFLRGMEGVVRWSKGPREACFLLEILSCGELHLKLEQQPNIGCNHTYHQKIQLWEFVFPRGETAYCFSFLQLGGWGTGRRSRCLTTKPLNTWDVICQHENPMQFCGGGGCGPAKGGGPPLPLSF